MSINNRQYLPPNFPTKPTPALPSILSFPRDIVATNRNFYTQIQFVQYTSLSFRYALGQTTPFPTPTGGLVLPLPKRINDIQTVIWQEESITPKGASLSSAGAATAGLAGAVSGLAINPCLWMLFKSPMFKTFTFNWTLAPNNEQESRDIVNIVNLFKYNQLPERVLGVIYKYPSIAIVKMYPDDSFTTKFRPCAIIQVEADYTSGSNGPSFFKNGAPTIINLSVHLKEIELWTKDNYDNG